MLRWMHHDFEAVVGRERSNEKKACDCMVCTCALLENFGGRLAGSLYISFALAKVGM